MEFKGPGWPSSADADADADADGRRAPLDAGRGP